MISDVLFEAVEKIQSYLGDPVFGYEGEMRTKIEALVKSMNAIRAELDTPPTDAEMKQFHKQRAEKLRAELAEAEHLASEAA